MSYEHMNPADIEITSMEIIENELYKMGAEFPKEILAVVKRVIHTSADFEYVKNIYFSENAVEKGILALRKGTVIITDTNMAKAGVNKSAMARVDSQVFCFMADTDIAQKAKETGVTRAVVSMEKGTELYPKAIFAIGNAPTALIKLCELIEEGLRPSLIIGVPVGFVNVVESKELLIETCNKYDIPVIVSRGRKGGSTIAAAICNALLYMASDMMNPYAR